MSDDRKKPVWPWIAVTLIGLPLLYLASFGPACWLGDRKVIPESIPRFVYRPLAMLIVRSPHQVGMAMGAYGRWGSGQPNPSGFWLAQEIIKDAHRQMIGY